MTTRNTSLPLTSHVPSVFAHPGKHVVVVADRFAPFADGERVLTISDLLMRVSGKPSGEPHRPWTVHVGQGIESRDWQLLESACRDNTTARMAAREAPFGAQLAPATVHKLRPENVLLANVRHLTTGYCAADLRIHCDNELVIDHRTGEHVQGMVIVEAMRQICIAQFETDYRCDLPDFEYAGVWKRINLSFQDFLFALPATVSAEVTFADLSRPTNLKFQVRTSICQNGGEVASAEIEYSMIKHERFVNLEHAKATRASQTYLATFAG
ncbi:MAG TPA: AfsA-related hotdog domain-containing protein [Pseudonocardiaceae bacterium]|nr:AfsA-related hotdog domain-containing protein [Pseudonocardiaceae bacterium]